MLNRGKDLLGLFTCCAALCLVAAPGADAKQLVGADLGNFSGPLANQCTTAQFTQFQVGLPAGRQRAGGTALPGSAGVVTTWRMRVVAGQDLIPIGLLTVAQTSATTYRVTGRSDPVMVAPPIAGTSVQEVPARLPIEAGGLIALSSRDTSGTNKCLNVIDAAAACDTFTDIIAGAPPAPGQTMTSVATPFGHNGCVMINADVEPDADNDGFGDETQDQCPSSASLQTACPIQPIQPNGAPPTGCSSRTGKARKLCLCKQKKPKAKRKRCVKKVNGVKKKK